MNIYHGTHRRQVGGGIWSTISRGIRPIIFSLIKTLKPHAVSAGKQVLSSAVKVGTEMAGDAIQGRFSKQNLKDSLSNEAKYLKDKAITNLKRKLDTVQTGSGNKRRRINPPRKAKMKRKVQRKKSRTSRKRTNRISRKRTKKMNKRKHVSRGIKKRKTKRKTISRKRVLKDIFKL